MNSVARFLAVRLLVGSLLGSAVGGCISYSVPTPVLTATGLLRTRGLLSLRVDCPGVPGGDFLVDGVPVGLRFATGEATVLDLSHLAEGSHQVAARITLGSVVRTSAPLAVEIDRTPPRLVQVTPDPSGLFYSRTPDPVFTATLQFDEPLDPAVGRQVAALIKTLNRPDAARTVTLADGDRSLVVSVDASLLELGRVDIDARVLDVAGNLFDQLIGFEWASGLAVTLKQPDPAGTPHYPTGVIDLVASWDARSGSLDLSIDGTLAGLASSDVAFPWDSSQVPDGLHTLTYSAPGMTPVSFRIETHNVGPRVTSCQPIAGTASGASVRSGVQVIFDREVCVLDAAGGCGGDSLLEGGAKTGRPATMVVARPGRVALPADVTFTFERARDRYGLTPALDQTCSAHFPAWRTPLDPLVLAGAAIGEAFPIFSSYTVDSGPYSDTGAYVQLLRIPSPASGAVERDSAFWSTPPDTRWVTLNASLNTDPAAIASQLTGNIWLETGGTGVTVHRYTLPTTSASSPLDPAAAPYQLLRGSEAAWLESGADGRRQLRFAAAEPASPGRLVAKPPLQPAAVNGSLTAGSVGRVFQAPMAVVVEQAPGSAARLGVWKLDDAGSWSAVEGVLNHDAAVDASEPTISGDVGGLVAWVEGGQVWARRLVQTYTPVPSVGWSAAESLNTDPTAKANLPRLVPASWLAGPRLIFVERGTSGEALQLREFDLVLWTWKAASSFSLGATVTDLSFVEGAPLAVLVTFDTGARTLLVYNE